MFGPQKQGEELRHPVSRRLTPDGGSTVHVLWRVLEEAVASVVIFDVVEGDGLEAAPA